MSAAAASPEPATLTVLFVDDEPAVLRPIARVMAAQSGFRILTATSGAEALALMRSSGIDVLVSDIDMPEMSGLELMRLARREFPTTLRILLTGAASMDRALNAINEGEVVRFFTKPFDLHGFVRALTDLRERVLVLRGERRAEAQRERCDQLFQWIEERYPGALAVERDAGGEVVIDVARVRSFVSSAPSEVRAFAGDWATRIVPPERTSE